MRIIFVISMFFLLNTSLLSEELTSQTKVQISEEFDMTDDFSDEFNEETDIKKDDPLELYNRMMFSFNDATYINVLNPVSKLYAQIMPEPVRIGIANVFKNIFYPIRLGNNLLQGKFENSYDETRRFLINSTIGVFGIMDPATSMFEIKSHDEDFGQTLGYWGVEPGPHIVLPFLGPSNLRDSFSILANNYIDPTNNLSEIPYKIPNTALQSTSIYAAHILNKNSLNLGLYESLKKDSIDFYTFTRDFYEAKRLNDIKE